MTPIRRLVPLALAACLAFLASARLARAQSANGAVTIDALLEDQLTGLGVRDLEFARLAPGSATTVAPTNTPGCAGCTSALFTFTGLFTGGGASRRYARITFTLPAQLVSPQSFTLGPTWTNAARACLEKAAAEYFCYPVWTPVSGVSQSLQINGPGSPATPPGPGSRSMNIYLGGTLNVPASQPAGVYIGTVVATFTYAAS